MKYFELLDELYVPKDRWFLKSLNIVEEQKLSVWKFVAPAIVDLPSEYRLKVSVREQGSPIDFTFADFGVIIVNEKVVHLLDDSECQILPVEIEGVNNTHAYFVVILLNSIDCVDEEKSVFEKWATNDPIRPDKAGMYKSIYKLVVDAEKVNDNNIFRLGKHNVVIIISEHLKEKLVEAGVTGVKFRDVS